MVVHIDGQRRGTLIDAIDDEFKTVLCDLSTEELEKVYEYFFVINNIVGMKVSFERGGIIFRDVKVVQPKVIDYLRWDEYNEDTIVERLIKMDENDFWWNQNF